MFYQQQPQPQRLQQQQLPPPSQQQLNPFRNSPLNYVPSIYDGYHKQVSEQELSQVVQHLDSHVSPESYLSRNKRPKAEEEQAPLPSHSRKTFNPPSENDREGQCRSRISVESNKIIDSKASTDNGAAFLGVEKIPLSTSRNSINLVQDSCIEQCCNTEECDNALLSLKLGKVKDNLLTNCSVSDV
jgi:hypothetical protein